MAVYTVPAGHMAYLRDWYASTAGAKKTSNYIMELRARAQGGAFQLKHVSSISDEGTSYVQHQYAEPEVYGEKVDVEMRAFVTSSIATEAKVAAGFDIVLIQN